MLISGNKRLACFSLMNSSWISLETIEKLIAHQYFHKQIRIAEEFLLL